MFGQRLNFLRKNAKLTTEELAKNLNVATSTLGGWERGVSRPSIEGVIAIADYFKVSADYLLGLNFDNLTEIQKLNKALREASLPVGDDVAKEDLDLALKIVEVMKNEKNN